MLLSAYAILFAFGLGRLAMAWRRTRRIVRSARPIESVERVQAIIDRCQEAIGVQEVRVLVSSIVHVPITAGFRNPSIIVPEKFLTEEDVDLLTSGIGHELIHVRRRDYVLNLIYEVLYVPLCFHPAAVLIKRRISQTRELCCDELVAEKLQSARVYARSLVHLAAAAPHTSTLAVTTTVGIADADNLEVRVMSLLRKPHLDTRRKRLLLIAASLLLFIPCVASASFALRFDMDPLNFSAQEPTVVDKRVKQEALAQEKSREEREREERQKVEREKGERGDLKMRRQLEIEARAKAQAELARHVRISMDQAIQIATSKYPGTVMECSLVAERWEAPGVLAKGADVFYHVLVVTPDDPDRGPLHVLVSGTDGRIIRAEKEELRREAEPESPPATILVGRRPITGGVLNGAAISLPAPEYPAIARQAGAEGTVTVEVVIDETGNVVEARAASGHPLLQASAVTASRSAKFKPTLLEGEPVRVKGLITYNFVRQ
jgi:TonB family protein